jgi:phospholipid-binding lipoprotein MlaA
LGQLPTVANDILQLNFYQAMNDSWRFVINSTVGIGGLFDVASRIGLKYYANDFGLTLAIWGWRDSTYLVLPLFGPNTIRDVVEIPVDYYFSVYPYLRPPSRSWQLYGLGIIDRRAQLLQFQSVFEQAAIDKYVFTRNAYLQRRAYQIEENRRIGYRGQTSCQKRAPYGQ